jgi:heat shock protein HslJ
MAKKQARVSLLNIIMNNRTILIAAMIGSITTACSHHSTESNTDVITYAIINTSWLLQSFALGHNNTLTVPGGQQYTLVFSDSTRATGINDCNTFSMGYAAASNGTISMQGYSSSKIYCGTASYDDTFKVALQSSTNFEVINDSQLKIYYADKEKFLTFTKR